MRFNQLIKLSNPSWREVISDRFLTFHPSQLSNLLLISNSVIIGFGPAMKTTSSRRFKRYPTTYVSFKLTSLYCVLRIILPVFIAVSKPMLTEFGIHQRLESCALLSYSKSQLTDYRSTWRQRSNAWSYICSLVLLYFPIKGRISPISLTLNS